MTKKAKNEVSDPARLVPPLRVKRRKGKSDLLYYRWPNPDGGPGIQRFYGSIVGTGARRREGIDCAFAKFRVEYAAAAGTGVSPVTQEAPPAEGTIAELVGHYRAYLAQTKGADWCLPTGRGNRMHYSLEALVNFAGETIGEKFTPSRFLLFRASLVNKKRADGAPAYCRNECVARLSAVRRFFEWCVKYERLSPRGIFETKVDLGEAAAAGLRDSSGEDPKTVPAWLVEETLPYLSQQMADIVRLLQHTGARPSEILNLTAADARRLDRSRATWLLKLQSHKMSHKGKPRLLAFTAEAQKVLAPYLLRKRSDMPLFPGRAGGVMSHQVIARAIARACKAHGLGHWSPYMIRRSVATGLFDVADMHTAAAMLGHTDARVTEAHYVDQERERQVVAAAEALAASIAKPSNQQVG